MEKIFLEYEKSIALSNFDIMKLLENKINLVLYPDISKYDTIDDLLGKYGACVILYMSAKNFGHWCCIFKLCPHKLEFFDPYGTFVDDELVNIPKKFRIESGQEYPYLSHLMYESPYKLTYNQYKFQKTGKGINTCGRWCVLRLKLRNMCLEEFQEYFDNDDSDNLATILTYF